MPRVPPFDRPATYDDLVQLPENLVSEIINGELHAAPRPAGPHTVAASVLGGRLVPAFHEGHGGPGGWWIVDEPEVHLSRDVVVPDLAGWRRARMPRYPDSAYCTLAPDWVCEILSPSTSRLDRAQKLGIYAREGVAHAWLIDPLAGTLEVLRLENGRWTILAVHAGDEAVRAEPFADIDLPLAALWGD